MKINFGKLSVQTPSFEAVEPRDVFMALPAREKSYEYPRDVQSEVWKQWFENRNKKNTIIKMNTGSGKTVVGLLILQSCLLEGKGPAVYVVPDSFLARQVCDEAKKLGIKVTTNEEDLLFIENKSILVINIHKLYNGKSVFGMRPSGNVRIGSIIVDDAHACFNTIRSQSVIKIPIKDALFKEVIDILKPSLKQYSDQQYHVTVESEDPRSIILVPFYIWQSKVQRIKAVFEKNKNESALLFSYPLLRDCLELCDCVITGDVIEVTPRCVPIKKITSFQQAERRVFMSATLSDDSIFVSALGLEKDEISNIVTPDKANDIGDRLMLFPQVLNKQIRDDDIKNKLAALSKKYNVVVIVPSEYRAGYWKDVAQRTVSAENIQSCVAELKNNTIGLCVFINKYDGVDLPDDACRLLVIDGLPCVMNLHDQYLIDKNPCDQRLLYERIQKLEQGLGRGVRSNNDYCVAILMGHSLSDVIINSDGYKYFSNATRQQYLLSKNLWVQVLESKSNPNIDDVFELAEYSLGRDLEWIGASKEMLRSVSYEREAVINELAVIEREAFELACTGEYRDAAKLIEEFKNRKQPHISNEEFGYLGFKLAEYTNLFNEEQAQELLKTSVRNGCKIVRPWQGIQYSKLLNKNTPQANNLNEYMLQLNLNPNGYVMRMHALCEKLVFAPDTSRQFEQAIMDVGLMLGFASCRPERDYEKGPDNLWALGGGQYLVIECKNETTTDAICKHDCNQLNGSVEWFNAEYEGNNFTCVPIMIHNSSVFEKPCSPNSLIRIITPQNLETLKKNLIQFAGMMSSNYSTEGIAGIANALKQYKLTSATFASEYTIAFTLKQ